MPCLTGRFEPAIGVLVNIGVHPPGTVRRDAIQRTPLPQFFPALIDTGASNTCISPAVARAVNLQPIGLRTVGSATHQAVAANTYLADLGMLLGGIFWFPGMQVLEFSPPAAGPYQLLMGRDLLCKGIFTLSYDGHFSFAI